MRRLAHAALTVAALATGAASLWTLSQNPFAEPMVERTTAQARLALDRALAREVTADWLVPRLDAALAEDDPDRVAMLSALAMEHGIVLPGETWEAIDDALSPPGLGEQAYDCAACAIDIHACRTLAAMASCALPFELTVAGDINALRREAQAGIAGEDVDEIEVGLALAGVGATAAVLVSGGTSYTVKAGATLVRVARRMGALTPRFGRVLAEAADLPVDWAALARGASLPEVTDVAKLGRLTRIAGHLGEIRANTSTAEALVLLRHVETAEDAARMARLSAVAGRETRAVVEVLGPARAFRALTRVSDLALAAIGLAAAFAAQLGSLALLLLLRALGRMLRPAPLRPTRSRAIIARPRE